MDEVTQMISFDQDKIEKILNDCILKFQSVKYAQELSEFVVETKDANEDVLETLNKKLAFVRQNAKKKRN